MSDEAPPRQHQHVARFFTFDDKDREWRERARCRTLDMPVAQRVALFFPARGSSQREAKECCAACPVTRECDQYATASKSFYGIWAGKARQRYVPLEDEWEPIVWVFGECDHR